MEYKNRKQKKVKYNISIDMIKTLDRTILLALGWGKKKSKMSLEHQKKKSYS